MTKHLAPLSANVPLFEYALRSGPEYAQPIADSDEVRNEHRRCTRMHTTTHNPNSLPTYSILWKCVPNT